MVKQAGVGAVDAGNPVSVLFGTVVRSSPLEINVDQRFTLTADFLIVPEQLTAYEIDLKHAHASGAGMTGEALAEPVVIRKGLTEGDVVLLLRMQGGQQFVVLDRMVSA